MAGEEIGVYTCNIVMKFMLISWAMPEHPRDLCCVHAIRVGCHQRALLFMLTRFLFEIGSDHFHHIPKKTIFFQCHLHHNACTSYVVHAHKEEATIVAWS